MILDLLTFDPGVESGSAEAFAAHVQDLVLQSWQQGAHLVLLPEFTWMGLEPWITPEPEEASVYHAISRVFWTQLLPSLQTALSAPGKAVVLGTVPSLDASSGRITNRAVILKEGKLLHQDKLHLTPWEKVFTPGGTLHLWEFLGFKIAVVICLDIEIPEISVSLRGQQVDIILCPSATETILGVERVDRCASARAVELGCHVAVSHLTGTAKSELIDENVGRLAIYHPSQSSFKRAPRWMETEVVSSGVHSLRVELEKKPLEMMRRLQIETNPAHLGKDSAGHFTLHQIES